METALKVSREIFRTVSFHISSLFLSAPEHCPRITASAPYFPRISPIAALSFFSFSMLFFGFSDFTSNCRSNRLNCSGSSSSTSFAVRTPSNLIGLPFHSSSNRLRPPRRSPDLHRMLCQAASGEIHSENHCSGFPH